MPIIAHHAAQKHIHDTHTHPDDAPVKVEVPALERATVDDYPTWESYIILSDDVYKMTKSGSFVTMYLWLILAAIMLMGIQTYKTFIEGSEDDIDLVEMILQIMFTLEVAAKLVGQSVYPWRYFYGGPEWGWNCFDFVVTMMSFPWSFMDEKASKMFRMARIMRMGKILAKVRPQRCCPTAAAAPLPLLL